MDQKNYRISGIICLAGIIISLIGIWIICSISEMNNLNQMDPCVGTKVGPENTHIWFHDSNNDGRPDYKVTYALINNKLTLLKKENLKVDEFVSPINPKNHIK